MNDGERKKVVRSSESRIATPQFRNVLNPGIAWSKPEGAAKSSSPQERKKIGRSDKSLEKPSKIPRVTKPASATVIKFKNLCTSFNETVSRLKKSYLKQERKLLKQIRDQDQLNSLLRTRSGVLEIPSKFLDAGEIFNPVNFAKDLLDFTLSPSLLNAERGFIENRIRENLRRKYELKKFKLKEMLKTQINTEASKVQEIITGIWSRKINGLELRLWELETFKGKMEKGEAIIEARIKKLRAENESEIEERVRKEYLENAGKLNERRTKNELIKDFKTELEMGFVDFLAAEKAGWTETAIIEVRRRISEEEKAALLETEREVIQQIDGEKSEIINKLIQDSEAAIANRISRISKENKIAGEEWIEKIKVECKAEMHKEYLDSYRDSIRVKILKSNEYEIRRTLMQKIEPEVRSSLESRLFEDFRAEFEELENRFRDSLESNHLKSIKELQFNLESSRSLIIHRIVEASMARSTKDRKISYLKKLDRLTSVLTQEIEGSHLASLAALKSEVKSKKIESATIKSQINVALKELNTKKEHIKSSKEKPHSANRLIREYTHTASDRSQTHSTPESSKNIRRAKSSLYTPAMLLSMQELVQSIESLAPTLNSVKTEDKSCVKTERKFLQHYDTTDIINKIIVANTQSSQDKPWMNFRSDIKPRFTNSESETSDKPESLKQTRKKHNYYNQLLDRKYGVIEPLASARN